MWTLPINVLTLKQNKLNVYVKIITTNISRADMLLEYWLKTETCVSKDNGLGEVRQFMNTTSCCVLFSSLKHVKYISLFVACAVLINGLPVYEKSPKTSDRITYYAL